VSRRLLGPRLITRRCVQAWETEGDIMVIDVGVFRRLLTDLVTGQEDAQFARVGLDTRLDNRVMDLRVSL
jgi:hypothetical protein